MPATVGTVGLTRPVSGDERNDLLAKALEAFDRNEDETGYALLEQIPLVPALAELVLKVQGREYCEAHYNLSDADAKFGEGWMNE
jgi:hypothetical protein